MAQAYIKLAEESAVSQIWQARNSASGPVDLEPEILDEQVEDLSRPAILVVEDFVSDGYFIRAVARAFNYPEIIEAIDSDWLQVRHGGGKDRAEACAREEVEKFSQILRVAIMLDSDRLTATEETKCHAIAKRLNRRGVKSHVLEYRETENYVPNHVLQAIKPFREKSKLIDSLKKLSPEQRAYFDMKKGFKVDEAGRPVVPHQQVDLYKNVPSDVIRKLTHGFGAQLNMELDKQTQTGKVSQEHVSGIGASVSSELHSLLKMVREIV